METRKKLFENDIIEIFDEEMDERHCIATIHNKTRNHIEIKLNRDDLFDIEMEADGLQDLWASYYNYTTLALIIKGQFEIVQRPSLEALNEEILLIVKKTIANNSIYDEAHELLYILTNDCDHIAEEVAEEVCKFVAKAMGE